MKYGHQSSMRHFLAKVNGVLSKSKSDGLGYTDVVVSEPAELADFLTKFEAAVPYPDQYKRLVNFIVESGTEYPYASEES